MTSATMNDTSNENSTLLFVGDGGSGVDTKSPKKNNNNKNGTTKTTTATTVVFGASFVIYLLLGAVATVYTGYTIYGTTTPFTATIPQEEMMTTTDLLLLDSSIRNDPRCPVDRPADGDSCAGLYRFEFICTYFYSVSEMCPSKTLSMDCQCDGTRWISEIVCHA
mmetsp:Transcript_10303/g.11027  ORF Transcript_10303/g.11027 Transcript_10303/m.11027 type:complete len:165 (+) Transcript_10303:49-543(+)